MDLLRDLFGEVLIPQAVYAEFVAVERVLRQDALGEAPWIRTTAVVNQQLIRALGGLGPGETEVLALAQERRAGLVIIDEAKGRRYAQRLGLPLTGTLGVLMLAKEQGLVDTLRPLLNALQEAGLRLHPRLIDRVLQMTCENN